MYLYLKRLLSNETWLVPQYEDRLKATNPEAEI